MVAYGSFFQTIVAREDYVSANSIVHGTRGASFLSETASAGRLSSCCSGPYALAADAVSFFWSALFLGRIDAEEPPGVPRESGGVLSGIRWIRDNAIIRAELLGVATINLFNFMFFALFLLYAIELPAHSPVHDRDRDRRRSRGRGVHVVLRRQVARKVGIGPAFIFGCFLFPAPLILVPAAGRPTG